MKNDHFTKIAVSPEMAQKHVDLVHLGFQSKVRAIMAIYQTNRETAEEILEEIDKERSEVSHDRFGAVYNNFDESLND